MTNMAKLEKTVYAIHRLQNGTQYPANGSQLEFAPCHDSDPLPCLLCANFIIGQRLST